jgi:hypothetical protein
MNYMNRNFQKIVLFFLLIMLYSCTDPRKNCNHPKHAEYVKEKQLKKQGIKVK